MSRKKKTKVFKNVDVNPVERKALCILTDKRSKYIAISEISTLIGCTIKDLEVIPLSDYSIRSTGTLIKPRKYDSLRSKIIISDKQSQKELIDQILSELLEFNAKCATRYNIRSEPFEHCFSCSSKFELKSGLQEFIKSRIPVFIKSIKKEEGLCMMTGYAILKSSSTITNDLVFTKNGRMTILKMSVLECLRIVTVKFL